MNVFFNSFLFFNLIFTSLCGRSSFAGTFKGIDTTSFEGDSPRKRNASANYDTDEELAMTSQKKAQPDILDTQKLMKQIPIYYNSPLSEFGLSLLQFYNLPLYKGPMIQHGINWQEDPTCQKNNFTETQRIPAKTKQYFVKKPKKYHKRRLELRHIPDIKQLKKQGYEWKMLTRTDEKEMTPLDYDVIEMSLKDIDGKLTAKAKKERKILLGKISEKRKLLKKNKRRNSSLTKPKLNSNLSGLIPNSSKPGNLVTSKLAKDKPQLPGIRELFPNWGVQ